MSPKVQGDNPALEHQLRQGRRLARERRFLEALAAYLCVLGETDPWEQRLRFEAQEGGTLFNRHEPDVPHRHSARVELQDLFSRPDLKADSLAGSPQGPALPGADLADLYCHAGMLFLGASRPREAHRAFGLALEGQACDTRALCGLGRASSAMGREQEAADAYERALGCAGDCPEALIALGLAARHGQDQERALARFAQVPPPPVGPPAGSDYVSAQLRGMGRPLGGAEGESEALQSAVEAAHWEYDPIHTGLRLGRAQSCTVLPLAPGSGIAELAGGLVVAGRAPAFFHHQSSHPILGIRPRTDLSYLAAWDGKAIPMDGAHLYGGVLFGHFGHFLAESVHRLWAYGPRSAEVDRVLMLDDRAPGARPGEAEPEDLLPFQRQALEYLSIPVERIHRVRAPTQVRDLLVPEQASLLGGPPAYPPETYIEALGEQERRFFSRHQSERRDYPERLFIGRSHLLRSGGIAGESYLEDLLRAEGFVSFFPERHSLFEQLNHYRRARVCVFSEGSALHALELLGPLNPLTRILVIARRPKLAYRWDSFIRCRTRQYRVFSGTATLPALNGNPRRGRTLGSTLAVFVDIAEQIDFLRETCDVRLSGFRTEEFHVREALDVTRYLLGFDPVAQSSDAFRHYFAEFRSRLRSMSRNPYLRSLAS